MITGVLLMLLILLEYILFGIHLTLPVCDPSCANAADGNGRGTCLVLQRHCYCNNGTCCSFLAILVDHTDP